MSQPLISVIMPTFKRPDRIENAIHSILEQSYQQYEIVIANDNLPGSIEDEATMQAIGRCGAGQSIRIVHTGGSVGGGAARNIACRAARGEYLAFLDDDDEYKPEKLERQMAFMLEGQLDMSYQDVEWVNESGRIVEYRKLDHVKSFNKDDLLRAHMLTPIAPTSIYMLKKNLFDSTDGFGEVDVGQDWFLMLRCIEHGAKIGYMPGSYVRQYLHKGDRLSLGRNKIDGETRLYELKRTYFPFLTSAERKYIAFRHYAVLAFACKRSGMYGKAAAYAMKAVVSSPSSCTTELCKYVRKGH